MLDVNVITGDALTSPYRSNEDTTLTGVQGGIQEFEKGGVHLLHVSLLGAAS